MKTRNTRRFLDFFFCDESEKCIYAQERTSVRGKTVVPP